MKHCSKCVMPETAETLNFDEQGVCSVCRQIEYKNESIDWKAKEKDFNKIIEKTRGKHDYDCIVPFSGGKDSTYTLWYLVKKKKLKPLVVRFDHGFLRHTVQQNALKTFRSLGVDVVHFTPNWQIVRKLMFEALRRRGDFCWHCHTGIFSYPMWVALRHDVPLVIWGEPSSEYSSFYSYDVEEEVDERRFNRYINLGINAEDMLGMLDDTISDYPVSARDLKPYTFPPINELKERDFRSICLGSYISWDVKKQVEIIKKELGWKGDEVEGVPKEYDYEKIECFMQGVRDYIKYLKRGFGRTAHLASVDIRNGRMSREEGMQLAKEFDGARPHSLDIFLELLEISEAQFLDIVKDHVVSPHEFPEKGASESSLSKKAPWDFEQWSRAKG